MANIESNGHLAWLAGPDSGITEAHWNSGPSLAELQSLENLSGGVKVDGTDFGLEASDQADDRSFADQAGAQSRGPMNASGNIEVYTPGRGDDSSIHARAYDTFTKPRTTLAVAQRPVVPQGAAVAPGQEVNVLRVETDARTHNRNDVSRTVGVGLVFKGQALVNYVVPAAVPTAPVAAPSSLTVGLGDAGFLKVTYQGRDVTNGVTYIADDETIASVTPGGVVVGVGVGTTSISYSYPGAAAPASTIAVTVEA